ncbi:MAG: hypothetical protein PUA94_02990 [Bacteroidales bacterium]|nr:hypothetical protein [Bacteroidales bacterium]
MRFLDFIFGKKQEGVTHTSNQQVQNAGNNSISRPSSYKDTSCPPDAVLELLEKVCGTEEKPTQIEKQKLQDGSIYTGQALLLQNGFYLPHGYGKKYISPQMEMTAHWINGNANGMCYLNMHNAMVTGHFVNSRPEGWCLSVEGGVGFVFGVFHNDDCILSLGESVVWLIRTMDMGLRTSYKKGQILVGEIINNQARGFHFMNNGDLYIGTDDSKLSKTGFFFKFSKDGYIQIGEFKNGMLINELPGDEVVFANGGDASLYKPLNTSKKYF